MQDKQWMVADTLEYSLLKELDGGYHFTDEQQKEDAIHQDWLEHQGYKVIRFTNEQVICDTERVINIVKLNLK